MKRDVKIKNMIPDRLFVWVMSIVGGSYVLLVVLLIVVDLKFTTVGDMLDTLTSREIKYAIKLSLYSTAITTVLSLLTAIPLGYIMSSKKFKGKGILDLILDIPIILPPLVVGLSLLMLFRTISGIWFEDNVLQFTYAIPGVILAQYIISCAFAVKTMITAFSQIDYRQEQVALTLGCNKYTAFFKILLPQVKGGILTAASVAWARALGEFGPILIFAGTTRMKTEVLSASVFLELTVGNIEAAVAISILMIISSIIVLGTVRLVANKERNIS